MASSSSPSTLSPSLDMFTRFPDLPTELRLNIWKKALEEARDVQVTVYPPDASIQPMGTYFKLEGENPALLHICGESREEALKVHTTVFETAHGTAGRIYLNPAIDTLFTYIIYLEQHVFDITLRLSSNIERRRNGNVTTDGPGPWDRAEHLEVGIVQYDSDSNETLSSSEQTVVLFRSARESWTGNEDNNSVDPMQAALERVHGAIGSGCVKSQLWEAKKWDSLWNNVSRVTS